MKKFSNFFENNRIKILTLISSSCVIALLIGCVALTMQSPVEVYDESSHEEACITDAKANLSEDKEAELATAKEFAEKNENENSEEPKQAEDVKILAEQGEREGAEEYIPQNSQSTPNGQSEYNQAAQRPGNHSYQQQQQEQQHHQQQPKPAQPRPTQPKPSKPQPKPNPKPAPTKPVPTKPATPKPTKPSQPKPTPKPQPSKPVTPTENNIMSAIEKRALDIMNTERAKNGLKPLVAATDLQKTAETRVRDIFSSFSHTRPNGQICYSIYPSRYNYLGENIAMGFETADDVMGAWMASAGHRKNLLNPNFSHVGIATYRGNGKLGWAQCFGG